MIEPNYRQLGDPGPLAEPLTAHKLAQIIDHFYPRGGMTIFVNPTDWFRLYGDPHIWSFTSRITLDEFLFLGARIFTDETVPIGEPRIVS